MKIINPGMIQVRAYTDHETDQLMYHMSIVFQTTIAADLEAVECDPARARAIALETGIKLLEMEIARHVHAE